VSGSYTWQSIVGGSDISCGATTSDAGYCWGRNYRGLLGIGNVFGNKLVPTLLDGGHAWKSFSRSGDHACGLTTDDDAYCWGWGTAVNGTSGTHRSPVLVSGSHDWESIAAGVNHTCAVTTAGVGYCWGQDNGGSLGGSGDTSTPVSGNHTWASISTGYLNSCGVTTAGDAYCWGNGSMGQIGDGGTSDRSTPTLVSGSYTWASISTSIGSRHTCGVTTAGDAYCWGRNDENQLGNGGAYSNVCDSSEEPCALVPTLVSGSHTWKSISVGQQYACGVTTAGVGYCWGNRGATGGGGGSTPAKITLPW
jgi:alpha-tubulin suppressor-like RCC1 family protein